MDRFCRSLPREFSLVRCLSNSLAAAHISCISTVISLPPLHSISSLTRSLMCRYTKEFDGEKWVRQSDHLYFGPVLYCSRPSTMNSSFPNNSSPRSRHSVFSTPFMTCNTQCHCNVNEASFTFIHTIDRMLSAYRKPLCHWP